MDTKTFIQTQVANMLLQLDGVMQGLTDEQFNHEYEASGSLNPIRAAFTHLVASQDNITHLISGKPRVWDSGEWAGKLGAVPPSRGAWDDMKTKTVPLAQALAYQSEVR